MRRLYKNAELVAKFYKYIGILQSRPQGAGFAEQTQASNIKKNHLYEPKDFSQDSKQKLKLINDARLGDEQALMFNENEIKNKIENSQNQILQ